MKATIQNKLLSIEQGHHIKILYACESGSRAWEFPSPDSDYDVRFIYIRTLEEYLSVENQPDTMSFPINDELDICGWDLLKILKLVRKSNTTPFEWLQSPIIYQEEQDLKNELFSLCGNFFSRRGNIHHYLGIARGAMETMNENGMIKIKKLFYALRPLLAAKWCLEKDSIAPMSIVPLMSQMPEELRSKLNHLIRYKATAAEGFLIHPDPVLLDWIKETDKYCMDASMDFEHTRFEKAALDDFFIKKIHRYEHSRA